jgi:diguanylate cyclase (GGDEF)-like protein
MKKPIFFNKHYIFAIITIIVVFTIFIFFSYNEKLEEENFFLNKNLSRLQSEVNLILKSYNIAADAVFKNVINRDEINSIIYNSWHFEERRDNYRSLLKFKMDSLYQDLKNYHVRQLHFHFKDGTSFLRMHRPDTYGDNLFGVRKSIEYVNREQKNFIGFEEGRIFNGYRYIYPISYKNEHLGSVEFSLSFQAVIDLLKNNLGGSNAFIVKKQLIENTVFEEEQKNYLTFSILEDYSYDREIYYQLSAANSEIPLAIIKRINEINRNEIVKKAKTEKSFIVSARLNSKYYTGSFISVKGIDGQTKGYLISYQADDSLRFINENFTETIIISLLFLVMTVILLTLIFSNNNRLRFLAHNDQLTEVSNRHHLTAVLKKEFERKQRYKSTFSFIIFDIDHFKSINDNYGHDIGDKILKEMSDLIRNNIRQNDHFGRWGGEEFVIIASENNLDSANNLAEKLRKKVEDYNFIENENITASFGVAEIKPNENTDDLIKRADDALYRAKKNGRNLVELDK